MHCKHIIFGASADNAYPSFLSSFSTDTDVSSKIRILKGPPFSFEFKQIIGRFKWTEFEDVFRSEFISNDFSPYRVLHDTEDIEPAGQHRPWPWVPKKTASSYTTPEVTGNTPFFEEAWNPYDSALQAQSRSQYLAHDLPQQQSKEVSDRSIERLPLAATTEQPPITTMIIEEALMRNTYDRLQESPKALGFGVVKHRVEKELGLSPDVWNEEQWFTRSKDIIKMTVVSSSHNTWKTGLT